MGKRSRSNLIADLKTAGQKGSLSKMNKTQLLALHSQITDGASHDIEAGQSLDMLQIKGVAVGLPMITCGLSMVVVARYEWIRTRMTFNTS